jgi:hypothetical protein
LTASNTLPPTSGNHHKSKRPTKPGNQWKTAATIIDSKRETSNTREYKKPIETMDSKGNTAASKDIKSTASKDIESQRVREPNGQGVANAQENLTKQVEPYRSKHSIAI